MSQMSFNKKVSFEKSYRNCLVYQNVIRFVLKNFLRNVPRIMAIYIILTFARLYSHPHSYLSYYQTQFALIIVSVAFFLGKSIISKSHFCERNFSRRTLSSERKLRDIWGCYLFYILSFSLYRTKDKAQHWVC